MTQNSPPPVVVDRVQKRFEIPREQVNTLKERALHPFRRSITDTLHALRGVSFAVEPGEFFGIVGRNGSGKSTLLKCLAGIYGVDSGGIYINGRMSTFIELGVGFNPDLPARDNALLNATMLGLSPKEARKRFDSVIDFAELGDFVEMKIKNYSSGMLVRLAFAVMIHVDAEILLIDEVLAVGDASFQQKCYDEFERIRDSGATVLFVTHDMGAVQRFCDRALLLEHGRPVMLGDPEHVGNRYLELNFSEQARQVEEAAAEAEDGAGGAISGGAGAVAAQPSAAMLEGDGRGGGRCIASATAARRSRSMVRGRAGRARRRCCRPAELHIRRTRAVPRGCRGSAVRRQPPERPSRELLGATNLWTDARTGAHRAGEQLMFRISFENVLAPDRYHATPAVARSGGAWIDRSER